MEYHEIATDDIDEMFSWGSGWDCCYTQLSAGRLGFSTRQIKLPDVHIEWNTFGQAVLFEEVMHSQVLFFGVLLESTGPAVYCGREMAANRGLLYPVGQEQEYRHRPSSHTLCIGVSGKLQRTLNWKLSSRRTNPIARRHFNTLVSVCEDVTAFAMARQNHDVDRELELTLRDRVVVALYDALEPWRQGNHESSSLEKSKAFELATKATQVIDAGDASDRFSVSQLSAELNVSERLIYDCFARCYGLGPYEFYQLRKLHAFRSAILDGKPFHGKISQASLLAGFHHMGRLTQLYRRHFGETPRETMRRRDAESS